MKSVSPASKSYFSLLFLDAFKAETEKQRSRQKRIREAVALLSLLATLALVFVFVVLPWIQSRNTQDSPSTAKPDDSVDPGETPGENPGENPGTLPPPEVSLPPQDEEKKKSCGILTLIAIAASAAVLLFVPGARWVVKAIVCLFILGGTAIALLVQRCPIYIPCIVLLAVCAFFTTFGAWNMTHSWWTYLRLLTFFGSISYLVYRWCNKGSEPFKKPRPGSDDPDDRPLQYTATTIAGATIAAEFISSVRRIARGPPLTDDEADELLDEAVPQEAFEKVVASNTLEVLNGTARLEKVMQESKSATSRLEKLQEALLQAQITNLQRGTGGGASLQQVQSLLDNQTRLSKLERDLEARSKEEVQQKVEEDRHTETANELEQIRKEQAQNNQSILEVIKQQQQDFAADKLRALDAAVEKNRIELARKDAIIEDLQLKKGTTEAQNTQLKQSLKEKAEGKPVENPGIFSRIGSGAAALGRGAVQAYSFGTAAKSVLEVGLDNIDQNSALYQRTRDAVNSASEGLGYGMLFTEPVKAAGAAAGAAAAAAAAATGAAATGATGAAAAAAAAAGSAAATPLSVTLGTAALIGGATYTGAAITKKTGEAIGWAGSAIATKMGETASRLIYGSNISEEKKAEIEATLETAANESVDAVPTETLSEEIRKRATELVDIREKRARLIGESKPESKPETKSESRKRAKRNREAISSEIKEFQSELKKIKEETNVQVKEFQEKKKKAVKEQEAEKKKRIKPAGIGYVEIDKKRVRNNSKEAKAERQKIDNLTKRRLDSLDNAIERVQRNGAKRRKVVENQIDSLKVARDKFTGLVSISGVRTKTDGKVSLIEDKIAKLQQKKQAVRASAQEKRTAAAADGKTKEVEKINKKEARELATLDRQITKFNDKLFRVINQLDSIRRTEVLLEKVRGPESLLYNAEKSRKRARDEKENPGEAAKKAREGESYVRKTGRAIYDFFGLNRLFGDFDGEEESTGKRKRDPAEEALEEAEKVDAERKKRRREAIDLEVERLEKAALEVAARSFARGKKRARRAITTFQDIVEEEVQEGKKPKTEYVQVYEGTGPEGARLGKE